MKPIFIDVDGTLRNSQQEITTATKDALLLAVQKNYEPILCTGRPREYALELCIQLQSHYLIYNSGAGIYDCQTQTVLYEDTIEPKSIIDLYELIQNKDVNFILAYDGSNHHYSLGTLAQYETLTLNMLRTILDAHKIQQIVINSANFELMYSLRQKINQIPCIKTSNQSKCLVDSNRPHTASEFYCDIVGNNTSKGNSIQKFCSLLDIKPQDCIAIGDDENDISMFQVCGFSVAMKNALPEVKASADYITLDNNHDGVASFIKEKLLV